MTQTMEMPSTLTALHVISTQWVPRAVRCGHCGEIAHETVRERIHDDEVVVRYACEHCRRAQTRHYHEELERNKN